MFDNITVIAFDLDDTLWPCMPTIQRAEKASYAWLQQHYPRITEHYSESGLFEFRKNFTHSDESFLVDLSRMRRAMLAQLAQDFEYETEKLVEQGFELFYRLRHDVSFYDDVFPVLDQLKGRFRLGSISNGNASAGLTALGEYFDYFINAADVMARKPDAKIFQSFCANLQVKPEHCLYVGDDPGYDVAGASAVGMQTIWVNREASVWPADLPPAQAEISNLYQLLDLLEKEPAK